MTKGRVAFIATGGGTSCAYHAGVARALQEKGIRPDIFIGSSGAAGTVSYFACRQADLAAKLWIEEASDPRVLRKDPIRLDIDFVIDSMRERFTLDERALRDRAIDVYLAITDYRTMRTRFVSNHENIDWYEVMRASMAMPFVYGRKVEIEGRLYFDGDVSATLDACIALARERGAQLVYVSETNPTSYVRAAFEVGISRVIGMDFLKSFVGLVEKHARPNHHVRAGIDVVYSRPSEAFVVALFDNSKEAIERAIEQGHADATVILGNIRLPEW